VPEQDRDSWHAHASGWSRDTNGKWVFADDLARDELGDPVTVAPIAAASLDKADVPTAPLGPATEPHPDAPGLFGCAAREEGKRVMSMAEFEAEYNEEVTYDRAQNNSLARHQRNYDTSSLNPFEQEIEPEEVEIDPEMEAWLGGVGSLRNTDGMLYLTEQEKARRKMLKEWEIAEQQKKAREEAVLAADLEATAKRKAEASNLERIHQLQLDYEAKEQAQQEARLQGQEEARRRELQRKEQARMDEIERQRLAVVAHEAEEERLRIEAKLEAERQEQLRLAMLAQEVHQAILLRKPLLAEAERAQAALKEARTRRDDIRIQLDEIDTVRISPPFLFQDPI